MNHSTFSQAVVALCRSTQQVNVRPITPCQILKASEDAIIYRRGRSRFRVKLSDLFDATEHCRGRRVTASEVRAFRPGVFDSHARPAGHSCNIGLLFSLLMLLGIAQELQGRGVRSDPYSVFCKEERCLTPRRASKRSKAEGRESNVTKRLSDEI